MIIVVIVIVIVKVIGRGRLGPCGGRAGRAHRDPGPIDNLRERRGSQRRGFDHRST